MVIPVWRVLHLRVTEESAKNRSARRSKETRSAVLAKLLSDRGNSTLQCVSLVLVLCASVFAYLYESGNGKGGNYPYLEYQADSDSSFFIRNGIDMQKEQTDIVLTGQQPAYIDWGNSGTVCGITPDMEAALHDLGDVYAWGVFAGSSTVFYENPDDAPPLMEQYRAPFNEKWAYYTAQVKMPSMRCAVSARILRRAALRL